ncbi:MAG: hypothetical protein SOW08_15340 [Lachnospiraceae bacterium]|nr:hypothetical protein [Lachnospiraceae bacterium]
MSIWKGVENEKKSVAVMLMIGIFVTGCQTNRSLENETEVFQVEQMNQKLLEASESLSRSSSLYFENGLEITGLGMTYDGRPADFDGCYYFPAMETMTGVHVSIDWQEEEGYSSTIATTLLTGKKDLPDIIKAVGEEHMDEWRASDGHIYTIPSVSTIQGSFSMMVRQDWLKVLGLDVPETWEDWLNYWRGVRDNDLNGNGDPSDEIPIALSESADGERSLTLLLNAFGIAASNDTQFCILADGTYTMVYEHPKYPDFLNAVAGLYEEGILVEGYESFSYSSIEEMKQGKQV